MSGAVNRMVIFSYGNTNEYRRAVWSILSMYAYLENCNQVVVLLFTDSPAYFQPWLTGLSVRYVEISKEDIQTMRGNLDFTHNVKIEIIRKAFNLFPQDNLLYIDSDTFFVDSPIKIFSRISDKISFMCLLEYQFKELRGSSFTSFDRFYQLIAPSREFALADQKKLSVSIDDYSWNAGLMGFHATHQRFLDDVKSLTDQFYIKTQNHCSEQYGFSLLLQKNTEIKSAEEVLEHYFHRVKKVIVNNALSRLDGCLAASLNEKLKIIRDVTSSLKALFQKEKRFLHFMDNSLICFHGKKYLKGYFWYMRAFVSSPSQTMKRLRDILYHSRKMILQE